MTKEYAPKNKKDEKISSPLLTAFLSVVAAATEYYNYCKNDNPGAVVVKNVAEAVIVHKVLP